MAELAWQSKFIGREEELRHVRRALDAARSGEPRTVVVGGEAGIGKTRLVRQVVDGERAGSTIVMSGACLDCGDSPLPFGAVVDALRTLAPSLEDGLRRELLDPLRVELAGLERSGVTGSRQQLFEMVLTLLEGVSERSPVLFVIEDLHWADRSTRDLLAFLVSNLTRSRVTLLVTYRSDELVQGHELLRYLAQLQRSRGVVRRYLARFDLEELTAHLDDIGTRPPDDVLVQSIWARSQGNPFYAEELLASAEQGEIDQLPVNLNDILLARIRSLSSDAQQLLRVAAVAGLTVDMSLLVEASTLVGEGATMSGVGLGSAAAVSLALREALHNGVLVRDDGHSAVGFRHALLREVAYADLLPDERRAIHARFAALLSGSDHAGAAEQFGADGGLAAELARHYFHANEPTPALRASITAADVADHARGYAETHVHLERVLSLWDSVPEADRPEGIGLVDVLDRAAAAAHLEGDNGRAVELARRAIGELGRPEDDAAPLSHGEGGEVDGAVDRPAPPGALRLALSARLGRYLAAKGESAEALAVHHDIVQSLRLDDEPLGGAPASLVQAEVLCAYAQSLQVAARHRESADHAERALVLARRMGDRSCEAQALTVLGSNLVVLGDPDDGVAHLREALDIAESMQQPVETAAGYRDLAGTLSGPLNRLDDALDVALRGVARVQELGLERHWGVSLRSIAADTLFRMGRWDEAERMVNDAIDRSAKGVAALDLLLARIKLAVGRGRFAEAERDLELAKSLSARAIDMRYRVPLATLTVGLGLWLHDIDRAAGAASSGLAHARDTDDVWFVAPLVWHAMRVEAERAADARASFRPEEVAAAVAAGHDLRALSMESCRSGREGGALRLVVDAYDSLCAGELRRIEGECDVEMWGEVASLWSELGQPYPTAYARWRAGEAALGSPKGAQRATPMLREAHRTALGLGAMPLAVEIEQLAKRGRIELPGAGMGTGDGSEPEQALSGGRSAGPVVGPSAGDRPRSGGAPRMPTSGGDRSDDVVDVREAAVERLARARHLTKREVEVLDLLAAGASNREIAKNCFISESTASVHVTNILRKLEVRSRVQAAALLHRLETDE